MPRISAICTALVLISLSCRAISQEFDLTQTNWTGLKHSSTEATLDMPATFEEDGGAVVLSGGNFIDVPGITADELPSDAFTIEANVAINRGIKWGNIVGYMQDNGNYERGFSIGCAFVWSWRTSATLSRRCT